MYGRPIGAPHSKPVDELIKTVLSQHTNDRNRDRALARLRERFPTWVEVREAPLAEVEEAIRPGGLGPQKAPRIQAILGSSASRPTSTGPRPHRGRSQWGSCSPYPVSGEKPLPAC